MALSISSGNGGITSQANTQSPQTSAAAGAGAPAAAPGKSVQPGTANSLLSGPGGGSAGIPLSSTVLPVANLNTSAQTTAQTQPATAKSQHHPNAALLVIAAVLVVLAVAAMWLTQSLPMIRSILAILWSGVATNSNDRPLEDFTVSTPFYF